MRRWVSVNWETRGKTHIIYEIKKKQTQHPNLIFKHHRQQMMNYKWYWCWRSDCSVLYVEAAAEWVPSTDWHSTAAGQNRGEHSDDTGWPVGCRRILAFLPAHFWPCTSRGGPEREHSGSHSCYLNTSYVRSLRLHLSLKRYLENDKSTEPQHFPLHGASEVSFPPEVHRGQNVCKSNQPTPHTMTPLHVEDELELWQSHVMI